MNTKYTDNPEQYAAFFFAENKITHPEYEYIIHLGFPRCFIKWKAKDGMFANVKDFFNTIAEVQWIDGVKPSVDEEKELLEKAYNFMAIEDRILEDDLNDMDDDDQF